MGCGASVGPSPSIDKYFRTLQKLNTDYLKSGVTDPMVVMAAMFDEAKQRELKAKEDAHNQSLIKQLTPFIEKSFDEHNTSVRDDQLDAIESELWFSHYVYYKAKHDEAMMIVAEKAGNDAALKALKMMGPLPSEFTADFKKQMKEKLERAKEQFKTMMVRLQEEYKANQSERNAAARKVLDSNDDGKIVKAEIVAALLPGNPKSDEFLTALGFGERQMKGVAENCGGECAPS